MKLWLIYLGVGLFSTLINGRIFNDKSLYINLCFLFIALSISGYTSDKSFCKNFIYVLSFISILNIVSYIFHIDIFGFLKSGTPYLTDDERSEGLAAFFEYRHYYSVLLSCAFFMNLYYFVGRKKKIIGLILLVSLYLTYTRSAWIAFMFAGIIFIYKEKKQFNNWSWINLKSILMIGIICTSLIVIQISFPTLSIPIIGKVLERIAEARFTTSTYMYGGVRGYVWIEGIRNILINWKKYLLFGGGNGYALSWLSANPYGDYGEWTAAIDVQYITVFMDTGIAGLFCVLALVWNTLKKCLLGTVNRRFVFLLSMVIMFISFLFFDVFGTCTSIFAFWNFIMCLYSKEHLVRLRVPEKSESFREV
jgi:hypothetical protein